MAGAESAVVAVGAKVMVTTSRAAKWFELGVRSVVAPATMVIWPAPAPVRVSLPCTEKVVAPSPGLPAMFWTSTVPVVQGTLSPVRFVRDGIYEAVYTAPKIDGSSRVTVTATIAGQEASSSDSVVMGLEPGIPDSLTLTADPAQITTSVTKTTLTASINETAGTQSRGNIGRTHPRASQRPPRSAAASRARCRA